MLHASSTRRSFAVRYLERKYLRIKQQEHGGGSLKIPCLSPSAAVSSLTLMYIEIYYNTTVSEYCVELL